MAMERTSNNILCLSSGSITMVYVRRFLHCECFYHQRVSYFGGYIKMLFPTKYKYKGMWPPSLISLIMHISLEE